MLLFFFFFFNLFIVVFYAILAWYEPTNWLVIRGRGAYDDWSEKILADFCEAIQIVRDLYLLLHTLKPLEHLFCLFIRFASSFCCCFQAVSLISFFLGWYLLLQEEGFFLASSCCLLAFRRVWVKWSEKFPRCHDGMNKMVLAVAAFAWSPWVGQPQNNFSFHWASHCIGGIASAGCSLVQYYSKTLDFLAWFFFVLDKWVSRCNVTRNSTKTCLQHRSS